MKAAKSTTDQHRTILVAEDDRFSTEGLASALEAEGFDVVQVATGDEVLGAVEKLGKKLALVLLDIKMPPGARLESVDTHSGHNTGYAVARLLKRKHPKLPMLALSGFILPDVEEWFCKYAAGFLAKPCDPDEILREIHRVLALKRQRVRPRCFVVHGRDTETLKELRRYLRRDLGLEDVVILREQPSLGRTIIEKFEEETKHVDIVFVLLTPDDAIAPADAKDDIKRRARQNVILEMGYFLAKLQRRSGNVLLLYKGSVELPSDISGVVYIDISAGVRKAGGEIRRELRQWL